MKRYLLSHWNISNCASAGSWGSKTLDTIYINQPQKGRRNRGRKAGMRIKEKEWETIPNVFTHILKVRRFIPSFLFTFFFLLCWNFIDFSSQSQNTDVKQQKKSVWVYKRAILPRRCSSSEIWESNIQCMCKAYGSLLLLKNIYLKQLKDISCFNSTFKHLYV